MNDPYLTKKEVANRLRVTTSAVDKWMAAGKLPCIRLSRRCVRFKWAAVVAAVEAYSSEAPRRIRTRANRARPTAGAITT